MPLPLPPSFQTRTLTHTHMHTRAHTHTHTHTFFHSLSLPIHLPRELRRWEAHHCAIMVPRASKTCEAVIRISESSCSRRRITNLVASDTRPSLKHNHKLYGICHVCVCVCLSVCVCVCMCVCACLQCVGKYSCVSPCAIESISSCHSV